MKENSFNLDIISHSEVGATKDMRHYECEGGYRCPVTGVVTIFVWTDHALWKPHGQPYNSCPMCRSDGPKSIAESLEQLAARREAEEQRR